MKKDFLVSFRHMEVIGCENREEAIQQFKDVMERNDENTDHFEVNEFIPDEKENTPKQHCYHANPLNLGNILCVDCKENLITEGIGIGKSILNCDRCKGFSMGLTLCQKCQKDWDKQNPNSKCWCSDSGLSIPHYSDDH